MSQIIGKNIFAVECRNLPSTVDIAADNRSAGCAWIVENWINSVRRPVPAYNRIARRRRDRSLAQAPFEVLAAIGVGCLLDVNLLAVALTNVGNEHSARRPIEAVPEWIAQ